MHEQFFELLGQTAEGKGGPLALLFLVITMALTLWPQLPGTWAQWKIVRNPNKPITALDTPLQIALAGYFVVFLIYGIHVRSIGVIFNAVVLGPVLFKIVRGLDRRRGLTEAEIWLFWGMVGAAVLSLLYPVWVYTVLSVVLMIFPLNQMYKIWSKRTSEGVQPQLYASFAAVTLVWGYYGWLMSDRFIMSICVAFFFLYGGIVLFWWIYRPPRAATV